MKIVKQILNEETGSNVTGFIQEVGGKYCFEKRPVIVIMPGGGYAYCSDREAEPVALKYASYGYQTFILRYSCRDKTNWPTPLEEYEQVMELIEKNSEQWWIDLDKIATIGFSAGGHLAGCTATIAKHKPAATILIYPVILKDIAECCMPNLPELDKCVDYDTVPCFVAACRDDPTVHISNSLAFIEKLAIKGIPFESHIYSFGGHGFSIVDTVNGYQTTSKRVRNWFDDSIGWLQENFGTLTKDGFTERETRVTKNGDSEKYLSVNCTLNYLFNQSKEVIDLLENFKERFKAFDLGIKVDFEIIKNAFGYNTLRYCMLSVGYSESEIKQLDNKLNKIVNERK